MSHWPSLVDTATIAGNSAIVVTLAALVWQTRLGQRTQALIAAQTQSQGLNDFYIALAQDPALARIYRTGRAAPENLSDDEQIQFFYACVLWFGYHESTWMQCKDRLIDKRFFDAWESAIRDDLPDPGFQWYWNQESSYYDTAFRTYIGDLLTELNGHA